MTPDMTRLDPAALGTVAAEQPYPLVFATVSGAHLYGFPSRDSDVDMRGVHVLPVAEVVGLRHGPETLTRMWTDNEVEMDLVTHDLAKFCRLLCTLGSLVPEAPGYLAALIEAKASGEHRSLASVPEAPDADRIGTDLDRLHEVLDEARERSTLPEQPSAHAALHDLVVRTRLAG